MTAIANLPDLRPSLLLDFANSGRVDPRIQCTRASSATCFGPDGKLSTVAANVPRIDYDPATGRCLGVLIEGARTNLATYSRELLNPTAWGDVFGITVADAGVIAPTGGAAVLVKNATGVQNHRLRRGTAISYTGGSVYTYSVVFKSAGLRYAGIWGFSSRFGENQMAVFDLQLGQVKFFSGGQLARIQSLGDGWYRCSITTVAALSTGGSGFDVCVLYDPSGATAAYTATDTTGGVLVADPQVEEGFFPSSYIPTTASPAARALDAIRIAPETVERVVGEDLTVVFDSTNGLVNNLQSKFTTIGPSLYRDSNNRVRFNADISGLQARVFFSGRLNSANTTFAATLVQGFSEVPSVRGAFSLGQGVAARACLNGGSIVTTATQIGSVGRNPAIWLGSMNGQESSAEGPQFGWVKGLAIYNKPLTDAQLQRLTS